MTNVFNILSEETFKDRMDTTNLILASMAEKWGYIFDVPWSNIQITSWSDLQKVVRLGIADKLIRIGDQFESSYGVGGKIIWDVIGINHDTPTDKNYNYSLTLQAHDCIHDAQFDAPEPTNPDSNRQQYGNNNYLQSIIKQWLNSEDEVFNWVAQNPYDVKSASAIYNGSGFLKLLDPELVTVLGAVDKQVAKNTITDGGGQDIFSDKVFLLSRTEVFAGGEGESTGEKPYPYYSAMAENPTGDVLAGRIKLLNNNLRYWWLRSPHVGSSNTVRNVHTSGSLHDYYAYYATGVSPACVII